MPHYKPYQVDDLERKEIARKVHRNDRMGGALIAFIASGVMICIGVPVWVMLITYIPIGIIYFLAGLKYIGYSYT